MTSPYIRTGVLDNSDGSCEYTAGGNRAMVSVTGPIEAKPRQELPQTASLEIVVRPVAGLGNTREKLLEEKLRSLLQGIVVGFKYPRQTIQIVVQFLSEDNGDDDNGSHTEYTATQLSLAINSVFYALVDAGVAIYQSFVSVVAAVVAEEEGTHKIVFDPSLDQILRASSHHVTAFGIANDQCKMVLLESNGVFLLEELKEVLEQAKHHCLAVHEHVQRKQVEQKVSQDYIWRG